MTASARDLDLRQHHGIETPEHVDVQFELAGVGSRLAAGLLDLVLLILGLLALWIGGGTVLCSLLTAPGMARSWLSAAMIILMFCFTWGYFTLFEALNGGRTPGKQALGIRVVMDTGRSITPQAAVVRNLVRFIDCYAPIPVAPALLSMFLHPSNKRPGDMAAGTIVVRDHPTDWSLGATLPVAEETVAEPIEAGPPELAEEEFRLLDRFLARINDLTPEVQVRITTDLVGGIPLDGAPDGAVWSRGAGAGGDPRVRGPVPRSGRRSGACPHVSSRSASHYLPRASRDRRAQRAVPRARQGPHATPTLHSARFSRRRRPVVAVRAPRLPAVLRPRRHRLCDDPRAARARRGVDARNGRARRGGSGEPDGGPRLRRNEQGESARDGGIHHPEQHRHFIRRFRRRRHGRFAHRLASVHERADAGTRSGAVSELRCGAVPADLHPRARDPGIDRHFHLGRGGVSSREGDDRPGRSHPERCAGPRGTNRGANDRRRRDTARDCRNDRRSAVGIGGGTDLEVRRERRDGRFSRPVFRERIRLSQFCGAPCRIQLPMRAYRAHSIRTPSRGPTIETLAPSSCSVPNASCAWITPVARSRKR